MEREESNFCTVRIKAEKKTGVQVRRKRERISNVSTYKIEWKENSFGTVRIIKEKEKKALV